MCTIREKTYSRQNFFNAFPCRRSQIRLLACLFRALAHLCNLQIFEIIPWIAINAWRNFVWSWPLWEGIAGTLSGDSCRNCQLPKINLKPRAAVSVCWTRGPWAGSANLIQSCIARFITTSIESWCCYGFILYFSTCHPQWFRICTANYEKIELFFCI